MIDIIQANDSYSPKYEHVCARCKSVFRYESEDRSLQKVFDCDPHGCVENWWTGQITCAKPLYTYYAVKCPHCGWLEKVTEANHI